MLLVRRERLEPKPMELSLASSINMTLCRRNTRGLLCQ